MAFKLIVSLAFLGIASAYVAAPLTLISTEHLAPLPLNVVQVKTESSPQFTFTYGVHDSISGDSKTATETRLGDSVKGEYSLNDADGFKRTVSYTADSKDGFQAVVERKPIADVKADIQSSINAHVAPLPTKAPIDLTILNNTVSAIPVVHHAAPIVFINSAPLAYSAPLIVNSAPILYSIPAAASRAPLVHQKV